MKKLNFEAIWADINCLVPIYDQYGANVTEVHLDDGQVLIDQRKTCSVVKNLAKVFAISVGASKRKYSKLVNRKLSVPIPLHQDLVLVPVKMRIPIAREDGAWGYLVLGKLNKYQGLTEGEKKLEVTFNNQSRIQIILQEKSYQQILESSRTIHREYTKLHQSTMVEEEAEPIRYMLVPWNGS